MAHSQENIFSPYPNLQEHRVIEVNDFDKAEILARVWKFDLILIDREITNPQAYLQELSQHRRLKKIPLVICDLETIKAAVEFPEFSIFPCLILRNKSTSVSIKNTEILLSVLQVAAGR